MVSVLVSFFYGDQVIMDLTKDSKKKKVVDVVSSIYATSGFLKDVVVQCHVDKIKTKNKSDISKLLPATVCAEEQEQPVLNSK